MTTISLGSETGSAGIDPRTKLAWLAVLLFLLFSFVNPLLQFTLLGITLVLAILGSRRGYLNSRELLLALKLLAGMLTVVVILQGFLQSGTTVLFSFNIFRWEVQFTLEGLIFGLVIASRFIVISLAFMMFFMTTTPYSLCLALYKLGIPYKYAYLIPMALDQFPRMVVLTQVIEGAQAARGFNIEQGGIWQKFKNMIPIMIPLVIMALREAGNISIALDLKGFGRSRDVHFLYDRQFNRMDRLLLTFAGLTFTAALGFKISVLLG